MNKKTFIDILRESIFAITEKRYFSTERGYQGQLLGELMKNGPHIKQIFPNNPSIEQEYQKTLANHGITIRPDIIIHIPYEREAAQNRHSDNFVVIQLKLRASEKVAKDDFDKLDLMFVKLNYPLGIFLNIDSNKTYFNSYSGKYKDRLHCFATQLVDKKVVLYESP